MSAEEIIRAWKDPDCRDDALGIDHPAGRIELTDVTGGTDDTLVALDTQFQCTETAWITCTYKPDCY